MRNTTSSALSLVVVFFLGIITPKDLHAQEPAMFGLVGFATVGVGTSGGSGGDTLTVSTGTDLQNALREKQDSGIPLVIYVDGVINLDNSPGMSKIDVKDVSDVSILGAYPCAEFNGIGIKIWKASNIIIRNLKIHHVLSGEKDCISIEGPADHIWIDHCELFNEYQEVDKDYYDGLLDAKAEAEYLTYSWNYLHDSWKTALVGSSEGDIFDRKLTMHHNYFFNCNSRLPLFRASTGHFFNNYFKDIVSTTINSRINSCVRIEKNYFENAQNPWVSAYSDILGGGDTIDNILVNSPFVYSSDTREMTFCSPDIPYEYQTVLNETSSVPVIVTTFAGVGKIYADTGTTQVFSQPDPLREPFRVYPNPCTGECHLEFLNGNIGIISISMIDITGKRTVLYNNYLHQKMNQVVDIDNHRLSPGIYILEIRSQSETFWKKIICGP